MNKGAVIFLVAVVSAATFSIVIQLPKSMFINSNASFMNSLQDPEVVAEIRSNITAYFGGSPWDYTVEDIFEWENHYLKWSDEMPNRPTDPVEILRLGNGKCQEFAYLFASAWVATGRVVRLMVCQKQDFSEGYHAWNQVVINGTWIDVDSSLSKVNSISKYHEWDWWSIVGEDCLIFSFDLKGDCKDATGDFICTY